MGDNPPAEVRQEIVVCQLNVSFAAI